MQIPFTAMQSLSRNFLLCSSNGALPPERLSRHLTGRQTGLSAEGVVFCECEELPDGERLYGASYYTSSGTAASLSAEALRALAAYLQQSEKGLPQTLRILSNGEIRRASAVKVSGEWSVLLPPPSFDPDRVGLSGGTPLLGQKIPVNAMKIPLYALDLGRPHAVTFEFGTTLENLKPASIALPLSVKRLFCRGVCTVFAALTGEDTLSVRLFDSEQGELDASSEGAASAVTVAHLLGICPTARDVRVKMRGGTLTVRAEYLGAPLSVTAEAHTCFRGVIDFDALTGEPFQ